jgi:hypothetical protein
VARAVPRLGGRALVCARKREAERGERSGEGEREWEREKRGEREIG